MFMIWNSSFSEIKSRDISYLGILVQKEAVLTENVRGLTQSLKENAAR
jgi:hypothetical protein